MKQNYRKQKRIWQDSEHLGFFFKLVAKYFINDGRKNALK